MIKNRTVYLDTAASTLPSQGVIDTMNAVVKEYANPSSEHEMGQCAKQIIDGATNKIAKIINCSPEEIHYTSGATMSNCLAIQGWLRANPDGVIITSLIEHNDIMEMCNYLSDHGTPVVYVGVNNYGYINMNVLEDELKHCNNISPKRPVLVSIQSANSEIGVMQNTKDIASLCHRYGAVFHTDATQLIPNLLVGVQDTGMDMFSMSGQKINCIKGTGLLYVKSSVKIDPIIFGEQGLIGGTENTIGIACLGKAFEELNDRLSDNSHWLVDLLRIKRDLTDSLSDLGEIVCKDSITLPNNIALIIKGIHGEAMVQLLSEYGFYISSGSACSSHVMKPSHVLKALGYSDEDASSCIRITTNTSITEDELNDFLKIIHQIVKMLRNE